MSIVLVTGGRNFSDREMLASNMDRLHTVNSFKLLVHGASSGADTLASEWAKRKGIETRAYPADWNAHGKAAGPIRNREMLKEKPDLVVAFPGGRGTADMVNAAKQVGVKVVEVCVSSMPTHIPDTSPVISGIRAYLNNRAPFDAFLAGMRARGLAVTYDGFQNKLLISPKDKLTEADTAYIKRHREEFVQALIEESWKGKTT